MAQKRRQYRKTANGIEEQLFASHATIVDIDKIDGLDATNLQDALEELNETAKTGGVTSVAGKTGAVTLVASDVGLGNVTNDAQVKRSEMGVASGVATLDTNGKVPSSQLPSYVDDIVEGYYLESTALTVPRPWYFYTENSNTSNRIASETGKIYVDLNTNKTYRYSGSSNGKNTFVEITSSLALGETSSTAYAGDKGKANATNIATLQGEMSTAKTDISNIKDGTTKVKKAESADKWSTARTISLKGDATGNITFDGSTNKDLTVTLANSGVTAGTYSAVQVDAKGRVTAGAQLVEWGTSGQSAPTSNLALGGLFFELVQ